MGEEDGGVMIRSRTEDHPRPSTADQLPVVLELLADLRQRRELVQGVAALSAVSCSAAVSCQTVV